ncbi:MAG TPA: hypothetical protein ENK57_19335, partial [Polyangiaceae bacterium]|nr:hypothetical protein [Polyangiaceae bacterium]
EIQAMLDSLGSRVFLPTVQGFAASAETLEAATAAYASSGTDRDRDVARASWAAAMDVWQELEVMQVGPAAPATAFGGQALRDEINSWPTTSRCRVDQETVAQDYTDAAMFRSELVNVRGLDAMEYLLFHEAPTNACAATSPINQDGTWDALGEAEIRARRAAYAHTLAQLVREQADTLLAAWRPDGGDFAGALTRADGAPFPTATIALNAVSDALFYVDLSSKDKKLSTMLELVESPDAHHSREHLIANLRAFRRVFLGDTPDTEALGFDDLLVSLGEDALVARMTANTTAALAAVAMIPGTLDEARVSDPAAVDAARAAITALTDDLKGEFLTALRLQVPAEAGGDTD